MTYALDTNTISFLIRGEGNIDTYFQKEIVEDGNLYVIPFIVVYELRRWLRDRPTKVTRVFAEYFERLFQHIQHEAQMPSDVWDKAVDVYIMLKQRGQLISDADILIAAYCLANDYTLVTDNTDDFSRIDGLEIVNWKE